LSYRVVKALTELMNFSYKMYFGQRFYMQVRLQKIAFNSYMIEIKLIGNYEVHLPLTLYAQLQ